MNLEVREARQDDLPFVKKLALDSVLFSVPEGRDIENREVIKAAHGALERVLESDTNLILVAAGGERERPVAYMILDTSGIDEPGEERRLFILDVCVRDDYRGSSAARLLTREAVRRSVQAGVSWLEGEVSAHNRRALLLALRLGFRVQTYRMVVACGLEGPLPMPGRPESEKHYRRNRERRHNKKDADPLL